MSDRYHVGNGTNWNSTTSWSDTSGGASGSSVPTAADDVHLDAASPGDLAITAAAVCRSLDCTGFTHTLTHGAFNLSIGDATAGQGNIALKLVAGMTYTLLNVASSAILYVSTSATQQTVATAGKAMGGANFNGNANSNWLLSDDYSGNNLSLTFGKLDTGSHNVTLISINSSNSNTRTFTLGSSTITLTGTGTVFNQTTGTGMTFTANTATFLMTGAGAVFNKQANTSVGGASLAFTGGGACSISAAHTGTKDITFTGTASKTDSLSIGGGIVISGAFTVNGNSAVNRVLVAPATTVTAVAKTITAATVVASNVDFREITGAGAASWDLSAITGGSGDCGGNTNITFTTPATQTWAGTNGGNWSANAWTSRVPLPQDDVVINAAFSAAQTVTADMPRLGKTIDWTGATGAPTFTRSIPTTIFGGLKLIAGMTFGDAQPTVFEGRASYQLAMGGKAFTADVAISMVGGTLTLLDDYHQTAGNLTLNNGTLDAATFNVTLLAFVSAGAATRVLSLGSGTWTINGTTATIWNLATGGLTLNAGTSTIVLADTGSVAKTFAGAGKTYNNLTITGGGTGVWTISGSNTFATMTINAPKNVRFTAGTTQTFTTDFIARGSIGNIITIDTQTAGTPAILSKASGDVSCNYVSLKDSTAQGGATWYAGSSSTSVSGNTGWSFTDAPGVPINTVAPAITGTAKPGYTLSCSTGTWTQSPTGYTYQWRRGAVPIVGATANTYDVIPIDEGQILTCVVTAANALGSTSTPSNAVTPTVGYGTLQFAEAGQWHDKTTHAAVSGSWT